MKKYLIILAIFIIVILVLGLLFFSKNKHDIPFNPSGQTTASWNFDTGKWIATGNPPKCDDPLLFDAPVDVSLASGILYPGQERGGDYKPHGGFRFDNLDTNKVEVRAIMDGQLIKASRYEAFGEEQILIFYINDCGIMVMHDHFVTLSPKLQKVIDKIPVGADGDSRTTFIEPSVSIEKGELLGTEIGFKKFEGRKNVFIDFGLYDLRKTNGVDYSKSFRQNHPNINEYGTHALCWFENLAEPDRSTVINLPAGGSEGKISDYCN